MKKMILGLLFSIFIVNVGLADGGFFFQGYTPEAEQAQQAVVVYDAVTDVERLYLGVSLSNLPGTNACWILTTPSLPEFEELSNFGVFQVLKYISDPEFIYSDYSYSTFDNYYGCGCFYAPTSGGYDSEPSNRDDQNSIVTIWYSLTNQDYQVTVFSASQTNVYSWLTNHNYTVSAAYKTVLDEYVNKGWYFTAIQFDRFNAEKSLFVRLTFTNNYAVFPFYISSVNSAPQQDLQLLYVSQVRGRITNYSNLDVPLDRIDPVEEEVESFYGWDDFIYWDYYPELNQLEAENGYNGLFLEYAGQFYLSQMANDIGYYTTLTSKQIDDVIRELAFLEGDLWLTRFYGKISTNNMRDIQILPDENAEYFIKKEISVFDDETNVYITTNIGVEDDYYVRQDFSLKRALFAMSEMGLLFMPFGFIYVLSRRKRKKGEK